MKVHELIKRLQDFDGEAEVEVDIWPQDHEEYSTFPSWQATIDAPENISVQDPETGTVAIIVYTEGLKSE